MARRSLRGMQGLGKMGVAVSWLGLVWGCDTTMNQPDPYTPTGGPAAAQGGTSRMENVPYCPGGRRDKGCLLGTNCRVTSRGCQVCQCNTIDD